MFLYQIGYWFSGVKCDTDWEVHSNCNISWLTPSCTPVVSFVWLKADKLWELKSGRNKMCFYCFYWACKRFKHLDTLGAMSPCNQTASEQVCTSCDSLFPQNCNLQADNLQIYNEASFALFEGIILIRITCPVVLCFMILNMLLMLRWIVIHELCFRRAGNLIFGWFDWHKSGSGHTFILSCDNLSNCVLRYFLRVHKHSFSLKSCDMVHFCLWPCLQCSLPSLTRNWYWNVVLHINAHTSCNGNRNYLHRKSRGQKPLWRSIIWSVKVNKLIIWEGSTFLIKSLLSRSNNTPFINASNDWSTARLFSVKQCLQNVVRCCLEYGQHLIENRLSQLV